MDEHLGPELRHRCLQKIKSLIPQCSEPNNPEQIEAKCYAKSKNDPKTYMEYINKFYNHAKRLQNQNLSLSGGPMVSSYQQVGQDSKNKPNSDPLNALQNLTVSAGQAGQMPLEQGNNNNIRTNPAIYNSPIRQRSLVPTKLQRPQMPQTLITPSSIQMSHGSSAVIGHTSNLNMSRMPNKSLMIKGESVTSHSPSMSSSLGTSYSLDSGESPHSGQKMYSPMFQRPSSSKVYQQSPSGQLLHPVGQATSMPTPPVPMNHIHDSSRQMPAIATGGKLTIQVSEEETKKVFEEIKRLKERYLKTLKLIFENPRRFHDKEVNVWRLLGNILENPETVMKPMTLKHIPKIEQHLMKAEQQLINSDPHSYYGKSTPSTVSNPPKPPTLKQNVKKPSETIDTTKESLNSDSLDFAFDDVFHQLINTDQGILRRVQKGLVKYVESKPLLYSHFLPKRLLSEDGEDDDLKTTSKRPRLVSIFDEDEFVYIDNIAITKEDHVALPYSSSIVDKQGFLRTNVVFHECDINEYDLVKEMEILRKEFEVEELVGDTISKQWSTCDTDWDDSCFYSMVYKCQTLPTTVPPIKIRIPGDYLYSRYVDWNLNKEQYSSDCGLFLGAVRDNMVAGFSRINQYFHWTGVPLVYVASVYKESILAAKSKHDNETETQIK